MLSAITFQSGATATGEGTALTVNGNRSLAAQVVGITVATVIFEHTLDGTNWKPLLGIDKNSGNQVYQVNYNGIFLFNLQASYRVRARISAYTSGTITASGYYGDGPVSEIPVNSQTPIIVTDLFKQAYTTGTGIIKQISGSAIVPAQLARIPCILQVRLKNDSATAAVASFTKKRSTTTETYYPFGSSALTQNSVGLFEIEVTALDEEIDILSSQSGNVTLEVSQKNA